jgi:hypothetical protein
MLRSLYFLIFLAGLPVFANCGDDLTSHSAELARIASETKFAIAALETEREPTSRELKDLTVEYIKFSERFFKGLAEPRSALRLRENMHSIVPSLESVRLGRRSSTSARAFAEALVLAASFVADCDGHSNAEMRQQLRSIYAHETINRLLLGVSSAYQDRAVRSNGLRAIRCCAALQICCAIIWDRWRQYYRKSKSLPLMRKFGTQYGLIRPAWSQPWHNSCSAHSHENTSGVSFFCVCPCPILRAEGGCRSESGKIGPPFTHHAF